MLQFAASAADPQDRSASRRSCPHHVHLCITWRVPDNPSNERCCISFVRIRNKKTALEYIDRFDDYMYPAALFGASTSSRDRRLPGCIGSDARDHVAGRMPRNAVGSETGLRQAANGR